MREDDSRYFRARALQEQIAAQKATTAAARRSHDQMAAMYRFKACMLADPLAADVKAFDRGQSSTVSAG